MKQVDDRSYGIAEVEARLGMMKGSHYEWARKYLPDSKQHQAKVNEGKVSTSIKPLKIELKRATG